MSKKLNSFIISIFLFLNLGLVSCSPKDKSQPIEVWALQRPYLKKFDSDKVEKIQIYGVSENPQFQVGLHDQLIFEDATLFHGASLNVTASCQTKYSTGVEGPSAVKEVSIQVQLRPSLLVAALLPAPILLLPNAALSQTTCSISIVAQNTNGSTHNFNEKIKLILEAENNENDFTLRHSSQKEALSVYENVPLIFSQNTRDYILPLLKTRQSYQLLCQHFSGTSSQSASFGENLISTKTLEDILKNITISNINDQFCRLLILDGSSRIAYSQLFYFKMSDFQNYKYEEAVLNDYTHVASTGQPQTQLNLKKIKLTNYSKKIMTLTIKKAPLRIQHWNRVITRNQFSPESYKLSPISGQNYQIKSENEIEVLAGGTIEFVAQLKLNYAPGGNCYHDFEYLDTSPALSVSSEIFEATNFSLFDRRLLRFNVGSGGG